MLHIDTPLVDYQKAATALNIKSVLMKLDNLQPEACSFKLRGLSNLISVAKNRNPSLNTIVSSSGGNAGLAATISARHFALKAVVFVPTTTPNTTRDILESYGAHLVVKGDVWDRTHEFAIQYLDSLDAGTAFYVHPFEHIDTWTGHSTLVHEINTKLGGLPDVIICSVGGGGLLCGILTGLIDLDPAKKPIVVCIETRGADSFSQSVIADKLVTLPEITSIAKSLGARTVSEGALRLRKLYGVDFVRSIVIDDREALNGVISFANDFRMLVEPACGAAIAGILSESLLRSVVPELTEDSVVVVEVCGGFGVTLEAIKNWQEMLD